MTEQDRPKTERTDLLRMVTDIVASYVRHTKIASSQLPEVIAAVYRSLDAPAQPVPQAPEPAVPIKRSVTPDYLICLEDGKKLKMLKRYLMTNYGMTPQQYREKWDLPKDYPMVAPSYALRRSSLAKESGLGRRAARGGSGGRGRGRSSRAG